MVIHKLFCLLALIPSLLNINAKKQSHPDVTLESSTDYFSITEKHYEASESFVYTGVTNFSEGQAAGLVFGASENNYYWVFNVDRYENRTKLLFFSKDNENLDATELLVDYIIGNDKVTESELNLINPKVRENPRYHLKVVITIEGTKVYGEFFVDNIKRFGVDQTIDLNALNENFSYKGGDLGYNVFNSKVTFSNITTGISDYSYYTEFYRNQYHYSQFSHWNNDPNGLVYYNGYYHLFYQTHPFSKLWSDMYWGHARSKDLIHWQELPIALFPDDGNMGVGLGNGMAWSGIAMVYHEGMSETIDNNGWFPRGEGLIGYYTRDGMRQDQVIITSDDEGLTWTKRVHISQGLIEPDRKIDCRDPSIFPLLKDEFEKVTMWGMLLSGGTENKIWFLKSNNMVDWNYAGEFDCTYPECATVTSINIGEEIKHVITIASRSYTVGTFSYNSLSEEIEFHLTDGRNISNVGDAAFNIMDYGEDSYAAQCFYIDDPSSAYFGQNVSISWFSGLPSDAESGIYETVRDPWNGGGMTIPVILGLDKIGDQFLLTQTPITKDNENLAKENLLNIADVTPDGSNLLADVNTHIFELIADFDNPNKEDIIFKTSISDDEFTEFGYKEELGYYVSRTNTSSAGINFSKNYHSVFSTGAIEDTHLSFYVLSDNGSLELFCGDFKYNFYNLTLAAPYSIGAELIVSNSVLINSLQVNSISSIWHSLDELEEGLLLLDKDNLELDLTLNEEQEIITYSTNSEQITYEIVEGEEIVNVTKTNKGLKVKALQNGTALINVITNSDTKVINVNVDNAPIDCFFDVNKDQIHSGEWLTTSKGLVGKQSRGDGFLISNVLTSDATYTASFDLSEADAAGLLLRADKNMTNYIMCNYDRIGNVCKVWSPNGELANVSVNTINPANVVLSAKISEDNITLLLNGQVVTNLQIADQDPLEGYFGLNVCSGKVTFKQITLLKEEYVFNNEDLIITGNISQPIQAIYNETMKNTLIDRNYYSVDNDKITISKDYFLLLEENTTYSFYIEGGLSSFTIRVRVNEITNSVTFNDINLQQGINLSVYVGNIEISSVHVNGIEVTYNVSNHILTIDHNNFIIGENQVIINEEYYFNVNVYETSSELIERPASNNKVIMGLLISLAILVPLIVVTVAVIIIIRKKRVKDV